ncbi:MAG: NfeD family protein [Leptolyngbyaceae cyanobacterium MO_188.B28]|nr:NfeD family protein [Leptolyngbyaceae cyanobacterium MO_188.B28]
MSLKALLGKSEPAPFKGTGKVERTIAHDHSGRVYFQATYWPAKFCDTACQLKAFPGESIKIVGRQGLTLLVSLTSQA